MPIVMVVDDEKDVVSLLQFLLEKDGCKVIPAFNGKEALEKIGILSGNEQPVKPDLVILDIMMPEIDGYTVQSRMMDNEKTKSIPILILTAKGQMRDLFVLASNVASYIEKPFDPRILRDKVKEILEKK